MKKIDEYVNSIYQNVDGNKEEINDLKQEMRSHLLEAVHDLKSSGKSEEEAVRMAIENFGGQKHIVKGLAEFFNVQKRFARFILLFSLISLITGIYFLSTTVFEVNKFRNEKGSIMKDVQGVLGDSNKISKEQEAQLVDIYREYYKHLDKIAVFNVNDSADLQEWIKDNKVVMKKPATIFPIDYQGADIIVETNGIISNKKEVKVSDYDLGTVVMANGDWIVQYEYRDSYRSVIERNNLLLLGSTAYFIDVFQLPILFLVIFGVLVIVWMFLKRHNRLLKIAIA
ncbi:permease prefix domain 1-containing protein [Peribacillus simplex]|uniref:permease prefix domain 1-containing protein n=1 Tax=Peribacillus simplex TaxID=1478 RepID=UPI00366DB3FB